MIDYKEKYEQAIERLKQWDREHPNGYAISERDEFIFPELAESEDEKIRKEIINFLEHYPNIIVKKERRSNWIAWLEKKAEQKPADLKTKAGNWYTCDMEVMNENMTTAFHRDEIYYCPKDGYLDVGGALFKVGCLDVFRLATEKEIPQPQPKQEWSEEDEQAIEDAETWLDTLCDYLKDNSSECIPTVKNVINKLKSLRPQNTWRPSDEQIEALEKTLKYFQMMNAYGETIDGLKELREQLKKLKE